MKKDQRASKAQRHSRRRRSRHRPDSDARRRRIEMARKFHNNTMSVDFKIRLCLGVVGFALSVFFTLQTVRDSVGFQLGRFLGTLENVPVWVVLMFDGVNIVTTALLGFYILTNKRGHYKFWAFYLSSAVSIVSFVCWLVVHLYGLGREHRLPYHLLLMPTVSLALGGVFFMVDKELRRAITGEYEFRQIIREQGMQDASQDN
eukprot:gnl/Chilomastix_cuspidata/1201.p1 GENE.gnl/Chilomastix_cuspidata/1201~~gnl/Chilomastix_cuspidata/1201.p1  ORF type:complete len:203 (-),score=95.28 gnl/Chilomastix_cuspidata/1201:99-707(-)